MATVTRNRFTRRRNTRGEMTVFEHLQELRTRLLWSVLAFAIASVVTWFWFEPILNFLIRPLRNLPESRQLLEGGRLIFTAPTEAFFIRFKVTAFSGFLLALPVILYQFWRFVTPGLYPKEKRYALPFVLTSLILFAAGIAFAFASLPQAIRLLTGFAPEGALILLPRAADYLSFVLLLVLAFGITFEMPILLLSLMIAGVITSGTLRRGRRYAWMAIVVLAAVITPTQDPLTMSIMALPLGLLYEATILVARLMKK